MTDSENPSGEEAPKFEVEDLEPQGTDAISGGTKPKLDGGSTPPPPPPPPCAD